LTQMQQWQALQTDLVPWTNNGFYLSSRPSFTFDPLFHAGCYYVQEASSMFLEQALKQTVDLSKPLRVLDLCAAPGGKSTHLQSLISKDSLLVANEVIRQRVNILKDNLIKWGGDNVIVSNNDPKNFENLKGFFDVIVVDAPCSGSGLFRRDEEAIEEWSQNNVMLCSQRQQRILANVLPALKEDGVLVYSTCSYSPEEDEEILDWLSQEFSLSNCRLQTKPDWMITEVSTSNNNYGYRFWPHLAKGEGFFLAAFKNNAGEDFRQKTKTIMKPATKQLLPIVSKWVDAKGMELIQVNESIYAWPESLYNDFDVLVQHLRVIYSGTLLGVPMHQKLVPDHALAMSTHLSEDVEKSSLDYENAIAYLQRENFVSTSVKPGWQIAASQTFPLGWMNVLPNRINNYYPKGLRILKKEN